MAAWPESRDDDMLLFAIYLHQNKYVSVNERFFDVMKTAKARNLPSYESITRTRREVQEKEPDLRGNRYGKRKHMETEYHDYYRSNGGK